MYIIITLVFPEPCALQTYCLQAFLYHLVCVCMFTGLMSRNSFVGCLKYAFFNDISILYELKRGNPKVHYIGVLEPEIYETDVEVIPITFPFPSSYIWWPNRQANNFTLKFAFKSSQSNAVLASSSVISATSSGCWKVSSNIVLAVSI
jgi:hypothetical protein